MVSEWQRTRRDLLHQVAQDLRLPITKRQSPPEHTVGLFQDEGPLLPLPEPHTHCRSFNHVDLWSVTTILQGALRESEWQKCCSSYTHCATSWPFHHQCKNQQYQVGVLKSSKCLFKATTDLKFAMYQTLFSVLLLILWCNPATTLRNRHHYSDFTDEGTKAACPSSHRKRWNHTVQIFNKIFIASSLCALIIHSPLLSMQLCT